nr:hypothetical protein [uncultured Desulfobulbus sp.]
MNTFHCILQDFSRQWDSERALSFIAQDPGGSFGLQARHETFVTCLQPGLARVRIEDEGWWYIAQPGAVVVFRDNVLRLSTSQFIHSRDRDQLIAQMEQVWQAADQGLRTTKTSYLQMEQALTRKLWEMNRQGEGYGAE